MSEKYGVEIEKYISLVDVAAGKSATQSSLSKWSKPADASRALDPNLEADFSFHTDKMENLWLLGDFKK